MCLKRVCFTAALLLWQVSARADTTLYFAENAPDGKTTTVMVELTGAKVRFGASAQAGGYGIYDARSKMLTAVDTRRQVYINMDAQSIAQMRALRERLMQQAVARMKNDPSMSAEQKARLRAIMASRGVAADGGAKPPPATIFTASGQQRLVNDVACDVYHASVSGQKQAQYCLAAYTALGISEAEYQALRDYQTFVGQMAQSGAGGAGAFGGDGLPQGKVPVSVLRQTPAGPATIVFERAGHSPIAADRLVPPKGYTLHDPTQKPGR